MTCHPGFECGDCTVCTMCAGEYYMVLDEVWSAAGMPLQPAPDVLSGADSAWVEGRLTRTEYEAVYSTGGMLCIGCIEARLGRELTAADFSPAPINTGIWHDQSERLATRLLNVQT